MGHDYEFDVAISFKSEMEEQAAKIAEYLKRDGWKVFFAPVKQQELLSENIHGKLYDLYKNKSLLKLLLISENYLSGEWTSLEMRMALKSTIDDRKRLLIVNYTEMNLPGEVGKLQYMDGNELHEDEVAVIVTERLEKYLLHKSMDSSTKEKRSNREGTSASITINHGIIAGDYANFGNIQL